MRTITIDGKELGLRATPLALLYYRQEFKKDLIGDLVSLTEMADDLTKMDSVKLLQMVWAMNKAHNFGKQFSNFEKWLEGLESVDFSDEGFMLEVIGEAENGFFRGSGSGKQLQQLPR